MEAIEKKLRLLEIDKKSLSRPTPQSSTCKDFVENNPPENTSKHLTTNKKRYSTSSLFTIDHKRQDNLDATTHDEKLYGHKRSASAGNESILLPKHHSVSDFLTKGTSIDPKCSFRNLTNAAMKKKWFQIPRISLKRQASTPPRAGYGGLKAGLVEPPEPPPQLLFNLEWSSNYAPAPLLWGNNVSSTPNTPTISRRCSGFSFDIIPSGTPNNATITKQDGSIIPYDKIKINRRQSCPNYKEMLTSTEESQQTTLTEISGNKKLTNIKLFSNFQRPNLRRGVSSDGYGVTPSASSSTSSTSSTPSMASPLLSPSYINSDDLKSFLFIVYAHHSNEIVLNFKNIKPRACKLRRKTNPKIELKALNVWQSELLTALNNMKSLPRKQISISPEKAERYFLTRKFIIREFYTTEINFWNQLNYIKVMYSDPLNLALERNSEVARSSDIDLFSNLHDLMRYSSTIIISIRNDQIEKSASTGGICQDDIADPSCQICPDNANIGLVLRSIPELMVVFLRCALDYRTNKKIFDLRMNKKAYALYNEKLALKKETRQFNLHDYLIIPIQRITRYGLLLADLEKHTEITHPDYENIRIAQCIVGSLAAAMNSVQKK